MPMVLEWDDTLGAQVERDMTPAELLEWTTRRDPANASVVRKAALLAMVNERCDSIINALTASYPETEKLTFAKQEAEARSYLANPEAATPMIDQLAQYRGIDKAELVQRIVTKADALAVATGAVIGRRQALEDAIEAGQLDLDPMAGWPA